MSVELTLHQEPLFTLFELFIENPLTLFLIQFIELFLSILSVPGSPFESAFPLLLLVSLLCFLNKIFFFLFYPLEMPLNFGIALNVNMVPK